MMPPTSAMIIVTRTLMIVQKDSCVIHSRPVPIFTDQGIAIHQAIRSPA
jgi:hypothetical protein